MGHSISGLLRELDGRHGVRGGSGTRSVAIRRRNRPAGRFYERVFAIKRWKDWLPDAARWFTGGFAKGELTDKGVEYWQRFRRETWRGELCHWCAIVCAPVFFLWNPWWGDLIIVAYAIAANVPCILAQRYNRARILRLLARIETSV